MKKQSQENFVKEILLQTGSITRNFALENNITRLAAIIHRLKKQNIKCIAKNTDLTVYGHNDFIYILKNKEDIIK